MFFEEIHVDTHIFVFLLYSCNTEEIPKIAPISTSISSKTHDLTGKYPSVFLKKL